MDERFEEARRLLDNASPRLRAAMLSAVADMLTTGDEQSRAFADHIGMNVLQLRGGGKKADDGKKKKPKDEEHDSPRPSGGATSSSYMDMSVLESMIATAVGEAMAKAQPKPKTNSKPKGLIYNIKHIDMSNLKDFLYHNNTDHAILLKKMTLLQLVMMATMLKVPVKIRRDMKTDNERFPTKDELVYALTIRINDILASMQDEDEQEGEEEEEEEEEQEHDDEHDKEEEPDDDYDEEAGDHGDDDKEKEKETKDKEKETKDKEKGKTGKEKGTTGKKHVFVNTFTTVDNFKTYIFMDTFINIPSAPQFDLSDTISYLKLKSIPFNDDKDQQKGKDQEKDKDQDKGDDDDDENPSDDPDDGDHPDDETHIEGKTPWHMLTSSRANYVAYKVPCKEK